MFKNSSELIAAVEAADLARVRQALANGAEPQSRNRHACTALHLAAWAGEREIVVALLEGGADVNALAPTVEAVDRTNYEGSATPLTMALRAGHFEAALALLEGGADVSHEDAFSGEDALFLAAQRGALEVVERLLRDGRRPVGRSGYQEQSALTAALGAGHLEVGNLLLASGYRPDAKTFCTACRRGQLQLLPALVSAGADVNQAAGSQTPLTAAASSGQLPVLEWLVAHGVVLAPQLSDALYGAANSGHSDVARWLAAHGAELDAKDDSGWTALMSAAWQGHADCVAVLLELGADALVADAQGKTALDWATTGRRTEVIRILKSRAPSR